MLVYWCGVAQQVRRKQKLALSPSGLQCCAQTSRTLPSTISILTLEPLSYIGVHFQDSYSHCSQEPFADSSRNSAQACIFPRYMLVRSSCVTLQ